MKTITTGVITADQFKKLQKVAKTYPDRIVTGAINFDIFGNVNELNINIIGTDKDYTIVKSGHINFVTKTLTMQDIIGILEYRKINPLPFYTLFLTESIAWILSFSQELLENNKIIDLPKSYDQLQNYGIFIDFYDNANEELKFSKILAKFPTKDHLILTFTLNVSIGQKTVRPCTAYDFDWTKIEKQILKFYPLAEKEYMEIVDEETFDRKFSFMDEKQLLQLLKENIKFT